MIDPFQDGRRRRLLASAEVPRLVTAGVTTEPVCFKIRATADTPVVYVVADAIRRPGRLEAYVLLEAFTAAERSRAWCTYADRITTLALELDLRNERRFSGR